MELRCSLGLVMSCCSVSWKNILVWGSSCLLKGFNSCWSLPGLSFWTEHTRNRQGHSDLLLSEVGGWVQPGNRFRFRFVRACARSGCQVKSGQNSAWPPFPFSLFPQEVFPFPLWDLVSSSEFKWVLVKPSETKWNQVKSSETKWSLVSSSEFYWSLVNSNDF